MERTDVQMFARPVGCAKRVWQGGPELKGSMIRRKYVEFFRDKGHDIVPSASLVPRDDASLLWINSGMAPLKKYFDGRVAPTNPRLANSQKCIRTNDIENVGKTARHHTFFEMLGNFSIGDYFKREAIHWAWEFLTLHLKMDPDRLSVTIHPEDDEAHQIWLREIGVPDARILRLEENFWDIGEGPCGPNSEVFFDRGADIGCGRAECDASCDCDRHLEIWNLVFSQYNHNPDGSYTPLPKKNIDTGMGLERTAMVLQEVATNYDTDLILPIILGAAGHMGIAYGADSAADVALRVIADHARAVTFSIADGVLPGNEGRGYVIRRLLRRAVRYGRQQGVTQPFLFQLPGIVADIMEDYYPEVKRQQKHIEDVVRLEEERFHETLADGEALLDAALARMVVSGSTVLSGEEAFRLYDTYGFPVDLTEEIAGERGFSVDREDFVRALEEQRARARGARQTSGSMRVQTTALRDLHEPSAFVGYTDLTASASIAVILRGEERTHEAGLGEHVLVVLDRTPFYAESGGQVADAGMLQNAYCVLAVRNVQKGPNGQHIHECEVLMGSVREGDTVSATVDVERRFAVTRNHTATHLLHKALREVLGEHVAQAGSLVEPERLRFDFSHHGVITREQLDDVERRVNEQIWRDEAVTTELMSQDEARELGAMALFGEKYGDVVRVVRAGAYSMELCGGCHVAHTGQIALFKLVGESGIGSGVRRIEALTAGVAYDFVKAQEHVLAALADQLRAAPAQLPGRVGGVMDKVRELEKEVERVTGKLSALEAEQLLGAREELAGGSLIVAELPAMDVDALRAVVDRLRERAGEGVIVLGSVRDGRLGFVASVSKEWQQRGLHAGRLVRDVAGRAGGSGGGRADIAQAGAKDPAKLREALDAAREAVRDVVSA